MVQLIVQVYSMQKMQMQKTCVWCFSLDMQMSNCVLPLITLMDVR